MQIPTVKYENHKNSSHVIKDDREIAKGIQTVVAIFKLYTCRGAEFKLLKIS